MRGYRLVTWAAVVAVFAAGGLGATASSQASEGANATPSSQGGEGASAIASSQGYEGASFPVSPRAGQGASAPASLQGIEVVEAGIEDLQAALAAGEVTSVGLVDAYLGRIAAYDQRGPRLNAIIQLNPRARDEAAALDAERTAQGARGPLHGIPIVLKDNYDTADMPTTAGSIALAGYRPDRDGFQVRRLREAGAVILAKANMHELAMGITTIASLGGQTRNPYDLARNPGGSSGGTGAAVAASFAAAGMGSDTCGSIRIPATHNNLVGLRPTKGLSSIAGIIPLSHTQDVGGPLARTTADLAIVLDATVGPDPDDPATRIWDDYEHPGFTASLDAGALAGARIGKLTALFEGGAAERRVIEVIDAALAHMETQGAEILEVAIPGLRELMNKAGVINYEFKWDFIDYLAANGDAPVASIADILAAGSYHQALRDRFERRNEVEARDSAEYLAALEFRSVLRDAVVATLEEHRLDALAYPTLTAAPSPIGEPQPGSNCSLSANSGLPAIAVPAGFTEDLLPVGLELLGRALADTELVALAYAFEQSTAHRRAPAVTAALVNGAAPQPVRFEVSVPRAAADPGLPTPAGAQAGSPTPIMVAAFTFDPTTNALGWTLRIEGVPAEQFHGATLHTGENGDQPSFARLAPMGVTTTEGSLRLIPVQRRALDRGELWLRVFSRADPTGAARGRLLLPGR